MDKIERKKAGLKRERRGTEYKAKYLTYLKCITISSAGLSSK